MNSFTSRTVPGRGANIQDAGRLETIAAVNAFAANSVRRAGQPKAFEPAAHFGWLGAFFSWDAPASNALTRERLGWEPTHPGLIADLEAGFYFAPVGGAA